MPRRKKPKLTCSLCRSGIDRHSFGGLCWACFKVPENRTACQLARPPKPAAKERARKGRPPAHPTPHEPGTALKVEVMRMRAARGESLFHADDARRGDGGEPREYTRRFNHDEDAE